MSRIPWSVSVRALAVMVVGLGAFSTLCFAVVEGEGGGGDAGARPGGVATDPDKIKNLPAPPEDLKKILKQVYRIDQPDIVRSIWASIHTGAVRKSYLNKDRKRVSLTLPVIVANAVTAYIASTKNTLGLVNPAFLEGDPAKLKKQETTVKRDGVGLRARVGTNWIARVDRKDKVVFTGRYQAGWYQVMVNKKAGWLPLLWLKYPNSADKDEDGPGEGEDGTPGGTTSPPDRPDDRPGPRGPGTAPPKSGPDVVERKALEKLQADLARETERRDQAIKDIAKWRADLAAAEKRKEEAGRLGRGGVVKAMEAQKEIDEARERIATITAWKDRCQSNIDQIKTDINKITTATRN